MEKSLDIYGIPRTINPVASQRKVRWQPDKGFMVSFLSKYIVQ